MARTRRAISYPGAWLLAVAISVLIFRALLMQSLSVGGAVRSATSGDVGSRTIMLSLPTVPGHKDPGPDSLMPGIVAAEADSFAGESLRLREFSEAAAIQAEHGRSMTYVPVSLLTLRPAVLIDVDPVLPESLRDVPPQFLQLLLLINDYGDVDQVHIESASELTLFQSAAVRRHFQQMRFIPGEWEGRPVSSALRIRAQLHPGDHP